MTASLLVEEVLDEPQEAWTLLRAHDVRGPAQTTPGEPCVRAHVRQGEAVPGGEPAVGPANGDARKIAHIRTRIAVEHLGPPDRSELRPHRVRGGGARRQRENRDKNQQS
ncbi:hypothetical protein GCM10009544_38920 [Streptomyces stramineus]|uniref:Uncharacterized protein n=1 Tax=Streptomyces stramineus TaxID=173861 RepID=A0ABN1ACI2_9ACTN